jgi:DNA invertase Pin-like site-specific DNA recombinase
MRAAIYARKSTDDGRAGNDETKSVKRQVEHARAYAKRKGWEVVDDCVFVDDNVGGAVFGAGGPA